MDAAAPHSHNSPHESAREDIVDADLWPDRVRLALSLVVNVEEGSELSTRDGDRGPEPVDELGITVRKPIRNRANESNYAYGITAGAPRVLDLLARYGYRATFTAAALSLERAPAIARAIADGGHEAASHGYRWIHQFRMSEDEERAFIARAADSIEHTTGTRPTGWLSRYLTTDHTRRLLGEAGFAYHMDDYSGDLPFWDASETPAMVVMPYALDSNDMKLWTAPAYTPSMWLEYACDTFNWLYREGEDQPKMMSLGVHLRVIGRPGRIGYLERFFEHVRLHMSDQPLEQANEIHQRSGVWIATRRDIAARFASRHPSPEPHNEI